MLFHVVESAAGRYLGPESADLETRADQVTLESLASELRARGVRARVALGHGDATSELARLVAEHDIELLVAGSHGHRALGDLFFGATTSSLRHRVRVPVLIIPTPERGAETHPGDR
jgi:manganese transport protein